MTKEAWNLYKTKKVRLIINDNDGQVKSRDGIFYAYDETHLFLLLAKRDSLGNILSYAKIPTSFLRSTVKRVEVKDE